MAKFVVTISRTELISFEVEATDAADAESRYLNDGDEVSSSTSDPEVLSVEPGSAEEVLG